jgi:hypothetical protein
VSRSKSSTFANKNQVTILVTGMINDSPKTQATIQSEMGLPKSNILTMFKQGRSPLPTKWIIPLCKACGREPEELVLACLELYQPDILPCLEKVFDFRSRDAV